MSLPGDGPRSTAPPHHTPAGAAAGAHRPDGGDAASPHAWHALEPAEVTARLRTDPRLGLGPDEARRRLARVGREPRRGPSPRRRWGDSCSTSSGASGDVVVLEAGAQVPADGRLIETAAVSISESSAPRRSTPGDWLLVGVAVLWPVLLMEARKARRGNAARDSGAPPGSAPPHSPPRRTA